MWATRLYSILLSSVSAFGITAGAHRLWAHKSYKTNLPLRILLTIMQTLAMQNSVIVWARDHRMHHKYSETDADPHNIMRGFFFAHMGWLLVRKHPAIKAKTDTLDMSDLWADPVLRFQYKYFYFLFPVIGFVIPSYIPTFWGEKFEISFMISGVLRYVLTLHGTWLINSAAHMWGSKPYDKNIAPVENPALSIITHGEAFHNYHHTFPWDYKAAELGNYSANFTTFFIDRMAKIGWAYDLRTVTPELIKKRVERTGDGTHKSHEY
ncbi:acyl-CoA Delta-9 desaturase-like [Maniola hyperantus]|uniref:acyl-CoA Delta-9 desaturase-like n=1 Tax=Aphantopus hyperantus TaxID=2795564 RepID=UPI0037491F78